ncbi:MmcQ/YjbR family DNA-binding protein [Jatrophihabitans cynanchi]|uniref:MmcQ/YjbR family DNA-binding protein n=1 Tax=Jatrophihabitans cynanchi TaxID=2944128 RepID=A0ABY7JTQ9_9ACTN|nr:MmcQ/YjbR family DNA-binding protein [Jatrophihabitans sp. SB3-54]WAX55729.1 MmcQ/YjbR family DNA-binding protein [Jatrophihabitans sp. SB3-54]
MATADDVRAIALALPRAYEREVSGRAKFRVGSYVFAALSPDESLLGFGFPKHERDALVASEPDKFLPPRTQDERYNWVRLRLEAVDVTELRELLTDAWAMCVPKKVSAAYFGS